MNNALWYILNKIRYCVCLVLLVFIALPFVPIIIFTNWPWIGILYVANEEGCFLFKAKKLYLENKNRNYAFNSSKGVDFCNINNKESLLKENGFYRNDEAYINSCIQNPSQQIYTDINHSWMEGNIYNR